MFQCPAQNVLVQSNALSLVSLGHLDLCISSISPLSAWSSAFSLRGKELKRKRVFVCACAAQCENWSVDYLYLSANSGKMMRTAVQHNIKVCLPPPSPLIWNHTNSAIVFSSLLWAQQCISSFIANQFFKVYAPLQLKVTRLTPASQILRSFPCFTKSKGYLWFIFSPSSLLSYIFVASF